SGLERVQRNVLRELARRPEIRRLRVVVMAGTRLPREFPANAEPVEVQTPEDILRLLLDERDPPDLYHLTWFPDRSPRDLLLPLAARASVVEVHDAILNRHPEYHPDRASWAWYDSFVRRLVRCCDRILVHSESVAKEAVADLAADPALIDVAPLAVDPDLTVPLSAAERDRQLARLGVSGDYFVAVGKDYPHKNHAALFRALVSLDPSVTLVCAGSKVWHRRGETTDELVGDLKLEARVRWVEGLDDAAMKALVQGARALVYPSLEEGFGLPPLEAMALGTLAIVSNATSMPEVCGDGAWLFDPRDHRALAALMQRALRDRDAVEAQRERGRERVASFSWARTAERTVACYRAAVDAAAAGRSPRTRFDPAFVETLRVIATAPFHELHELRHWQERCHAAERHARAVEGNRDEILRQWNVLRAQNGQPPIPPPRDVVKRPRWSLRRRWGKIRARLRERFGER
ncbi:MAG TPA: glycosyltransferase family 1 protein, partial [Planctomycetota bacterium]|nr:glycosyltransferase family 1 protein [Planctomycetota bacterium]